MKHHLRGGLVHSLSSGQLRITLPLGIVVPVLRSGRNRLPCQKIIPYNSTELLLAQYGCPARSHPVPHEEAFGAEARFDAGCPLRRMRE
jgi:hypothetical protein